ncbi:steroid receptor RNA activator 1-like isoform X2 [Amblyomma americanum]
MAALRPGNDDKAWNDPPVFAYTGVQGTPAAAAPKRNLLNKRVPFPQDGLKSQSAPASTSTALPPSGPPTTLVEATKIADTKEVNDTSKAVDACPPECLKDETFNHLDKIVVKCSKDMEKRRQDDVKKRLGVLKSFWEQGKLSLPVQQRLRELALELLNGNHVKADSLHVSLMVDYASEVSQWMLGIKHLILAAQTSQEEPACDDQPSQEKPACDDQPSQEKPACDDQPLQEKTACDDQPSQEKPVCDDQTSQEKFDCDTEGST